MLCHLKVRRKKFRIYRCHPVLYTHFEEQIRYGTIRIRDTDSYQYLRYINGSETPIFCVKKVDYVTAHTRNELLSTGILRPHLSRRSSVIVDESFSSMGALQK